MFLFYVPADLLCGDKAGLDMDIREEEDPDTIIPGGDIIPDLIYFFAALKADLTAGRGLVFCKGYVSDYMLMWFDETQYAIDDNGGQDDACCYNKYPNKRSHHIKLLFFHIIIYTNALSVI